MLLGLKCAMGKAGFGGDFPQGGTFHAVPGDNAPGCINQFQAPLIMANNLWHDAAPREILRTNSCDPSYVRLILYVYRK